MRPCVLVHQAAVKAPVLNNTVEKRAVLKLPPRSMSDLSFRSVLQDLGTLQNSQKGVKVCQTD